MMKYPLYEELSRQVKEQSTDIGHVCPTINAISLNNADYIDHYEEIYALILHYELLTNANILLTLTPFESKVLPGNKGIIDILIKLPLALRKIIIQYIEYYS